MKKIFDGILLRVIDNKNVDGLKIDKHGNISQILRYRILTDALLTLHPAGYRIFECIQPEKLTKFLENLVKKQTKVNCF